jgi:hypothetical protein
MTSLTAMEGKTRPSLEYLSKACKRIDKDFNKHISIAEFKTFLMSENKIL